MELSVYLDGVRDNARLFVEAVRKSGLDAPVPTCPDWTAADLARHQGRVFYWISSRPFKWQAEMRRIAENRSTG